jgi:hypothetical protein
MSAALTTGHNVRGYAAWPKVCDDLEPLRAQHRDQQDSRPAQHLSGLLETTMMTTSCLCAGDPDTEAPEWLPAGQDLREVIAQLRLMLTAGISFAVATVVGAHGTVLRPPGSVLVISESGETIGFNPAGPLDGAIRDLAAAALATGQDQLGHLEIDRDAASYIGLSGAASLDIHATRVQAGMPRCG